MYMIVMRKARTLLLLCLLLSLFLNFALFLSLLLPVAALIALPSHLAIPTVLVLLSVGCFEQVLTTARAIPPWVPTPEDDLRNVFAAIKLGATDGRRPFVELGAGDGRNLVLAVKALNFTSAIGLEFNPLLYLLSRWRVWREGMAGQITVRRADLFTSPLPEASCVYLYLSQEALETLAPRLALTYGGTTTIVLSRDFELPRTWPVLYDLERGRTHLRAYRVP